MLRSIDVLMVGALIAGAAWTFKVKHDARIEAARVAHLETRIRLENEAIDILKADWSLLTSPDRLERLADRYKDQLGLEPADPRQIVTLDQVPLRQEALPPIDDERVEAPAPDRQTMTGSVRRTLEAPVPETQRRAIEAPVPAAERQATGWADLRETTAEAAAREGAGQ